MTGPHLTPEREAAELRAALEASTAIMIRAARHIRRNALSFGILVREIDAQVQANQVALGLAVPEADK